MPFYDKRIKAKYDAYLYEWVNSALAIGSLVVILFVPLDYLVIPSHFRLFLSYRVVTSLLLSILCWLNRRKVNELYQSAISVIAVMTVSTMLAMMIAKFGGHRSPYFAGMILVAIFGIGFIPLQLMTGLVSCLLIYLIYLFPIMIYDTIKDWPYFISSNFLLVYCLSSLLALRYLAQKKLMKEFALQYQVERSERQLAESQRIAHVGSWEHNLKTGRVFWSDELFRLLGLNPGKDPADFGIFFKMIHPDDQPLLKKAMDDTVKYHRPLSLDYRLILRNGEIRVIHAQAELVHDESGEATVLSGTGQDITEKKKAEEERSRLGELVDASPASITVHDFEGNFLYANRRTYELHGYTKEEFMSLNLRQLDAPETAQLIGDRLREIMERGEASFEVSHLRKDGAVMPMHVVARLSAWGDAAVVQSIANDITERKKAEAMLHKANEKLLLYALAMSEAMDGIQIVDLKGYVIYSNKAIERIFGFSADELLGRHVGSMNLDPDFADAEIIPEIKKTGRWDGEVKVVHKKGNSFPIWLSTSLVRDDEGSPLAMIGVIRDITGLKKAEDQLRSAVRDKETLLRELYHRTKNNMQVIMSLISLQIAGVSNKEDALLLHDTQNRIMSMALVHEKLYGAKDLSNVDLRDYIEDLSGALFRSYRIDPDKITRCLEIDDMVLSIDTTIPIGLIMTELMTNTLKYAFPVNNRGEIKISAHLCGNGEIEIIYGDNGIGIPAGIDFRKTDSLGLKLVHNLVMNQLQGRLSLKKDGGSTFIIVFKESPRM